MHSLKLPCSPTNSNHSLTTIMISSPARIFLLSVGAISVCIILKPFFPFVLAFTFEFVQNICNTVSWWLKPPFIYLVINAIIIAVAALSHLRHRLAAADINSDFNQSINVSGKTLQPPKVNAVAEKQGEDKMVEDGGVQYVGYDQLGGGEDVEADDMLMEKSVYTSSLQIISPEMPPAGLPLVHSRKPLSFGTRRPVEATPILEGSKVGGRVKVATSAKKHETLDNTWKMITAGRPEVAIKGRLEKPKTFDYYHVSVNESPNQQDPIRPMRSVAESETFKEKSNYPSQIRLKIRKEASLGQDELNRRVEAFIDKFNEEMRLQREESLNRFMEMMNRGVS